MKYGRILLTVAAIGFVGAADVAHAKPALEVLGVKYGDTMKAAQDALKSQGFRPANSFAPDNCSRSYADLVAIAAKHANGITDMGMVRCETSWQDSAGRSVRMVSVVTPAGYRVSRVRYTMPVAGGAAAVAPALAKKFGAAKVSRARIGGIVHEFSGAQPGVHIYLSEEGMSKSSVNIFLATPNQYADDQRALNGVQQAAAAQRTGGRLKL